MNFNTIAYFQFDNLMRSRVPLSLILLDEIDFSSWYNSIVRMHLEVITQKLSAPEVLPFVKKSNFDPQFGLLILDHDGSKSRTVVEELEKAGYLNVYFIEGGFQQLLTEKNQNPN